MGYTDKKVKYQSFIIKLLIVALYFKHIQACQEPDLMH